MRGVRPALLVILAAPCAGAGDRVRERHEPAARARRAAARRVRAARRARRRTRAAGAAAAHREPAACRPRRRCRHGSRRQSACVCSSRSARRSCRAPARSVSTSLSSPSARPSPRDRDRGWIVPALQAAHTDPHRDLQHSWRRGGGRHTARAPRLWSPRWRWRLCCSWHRPAAAQPRPAVCHRCGIPSRTACRRCRCSSSADASASRASRISSSTKRSTPCDTCRASTSAAVTSQLPLSGDRDEYGAHFDATPARQAESVSVFRYAVSPGYFETTRHPLRARPVVRRSRSRRRAARRGDQRVARAAPIRAAIALGQRLRIGPAAPYTIVGVVGDVKQVSLALERRGRRVLPAARSGDVRR